MPVEILVVSVARALIEVAALFLLGQGMLWLFGPRARDGNFVYDLLKKDTRPFIRITRFITPRFVHDAHIGLVALFILGWLWIALAVAMRYLCAAQGLHCILHRFASA